MGQLVVKGSYPHQQVYPANDHRDDDEEACEVQQVANGKRNGAEYDVPEALEGTEDITIVKRGQTEPMREDELDGEYE
jgi:hypothetical protein